MIFLNSGFWIIIGVVFFLGLSFGWCFRKFSIFWAIVAYFVFLPIVGMIIEIDHWIFTVPFILGSLVHTYKPILERIRGL